MVETDPKLACRFLCSLKIQPVPRRLMDDIVFASQYHEYILSATGPRSDQAREA